MRIDDIEIGAEYTDDRTHYVHSVRPRRYRAERIGRPEGASRRVVIITELDPETGEAYPEGYEVTRGRGSHTYSEPCRTGGFMAARDLEPYGPAREAWEAWTSAFRKVSATAATIREALGLTPGTARVRPVVAVRSTGLESRVELELNAEQAEHLAAQLERVARLQAPDLGQGPIVAQEVQG